MGEKLYCGIDKDHYGGMTPLGAIIKDGWLFGLIPESETGENWSHGRLQVLYDQTRVEWDKYGCLASNLPETLKQRHAAIHDRAVANARQRGWDPDLSHEE